MANLSELTDTNFRDAVEKTESPVLVDFSATWCQPCKAMAPHIEAVASEYSGKLDVYTADIETARETATQFGVSSVPTCILFKSGKEVDRFTGSQDLRFIKDRVDKVLA